MSDRVGRAREEVANVLLGELLSERGIAAQAERRADGDAPDLRIGRLAGDEFALVECKWAGARTQLDAQLTERMREFPAAIGRIGVLYPAGLDTAADVGRALAEAEDLSWYLHSTRERVEPDPQMRRGSAHQLADFLRVLPLQVEGVDRVAAAANAVRYATETAAKELSRHARISERVSAEIAESDRETDQSAALRIGCLVLFNALAFEERLSAAHPQVPTVSEAAKRGAPGLRDAWRMICWEIDYVPVFQLAADILDILCDAPARAQNAVIEALIRAVDDTRGVEGHDLSGRLFHTLLSDAKFTGAYYTSVPAATLLTRLVFDQWPAGTDWTDHEFPGSLLAERGGHRLRDGHAADGGRVRVRAAAHRGGRERGRAAAQGDGGAGAARVRRAAFGGPFRGDEPGDAESGDPLRPHEFVRDAAGGVGRGRETGFAGLPRPERSRRAISARRGRVGRDRRAGQSAWNEGGGGNRSI